MRAARDSIAIYIFAFSRSCVQEGHKACHIERRHGGVEVLQKLALLTEYLEDLHEARQPLVLAGVRDSNLS